MYWEEAIELIKTHQTKPGVIYEYERGTLKSGFIRIDEFSEKLKDSIKNYLKYDLSEIQLFCSLGASKGIGEHTDPCNVLIVCLEGEISYTVEGMKPVSLNAGDSIFISEGLRHFAVSSTVPRICLSTEVRGYLPREEVTYYFDVDTSGRNWR
tara:strand:+ start:61 stop:519 length:459 start_codon:yes stop_codon:yes gene_type:complete